MRILIDTNIFIQLEDSNKEIANEFAEFHKVSMKHCQLRIHPKSREDIERDLDVKRKNEMLSRIKKYEELESPPEPPIDFLKEINCNVSNPRDLVDAYILYALRQNCIAVLISEDAGLHAKARRCSIENVYTIPEGLSFLKALFEKIQVEIPHIYNEKLYNLNKDDSILDSLKDDYPEVKDSPSFEKWFVKCQKDGRDAWVYYLNRSKNIGGICIHKDESSNCKLYSGKVMKVCTFKVSEQAQGNKVGELLIKNLFMYCIENRFEKAYVTVFEKHSLLIDLFIEFGFQLDTRLTARGEKILIKEFAKPDVKETNIFSKMDFYVKYSPYFYVKKAENKYIIPIIPDWHTLLFPDYKMPQMELFPTTESYASGNSIKKAYLCNNKRKDLKVGDLILFYRSQDLKKITTLGIIENIKRSSDADEVSAFVGKRTVFPLESIQKMCKKEILAILFRQIGHLDAGMSFQDLSNRKIINNHLESITAISHNSFVTLAEKFKDECILTN